MGSQDLFKFIGIFLQNINPSSEVIKRWILPDSEEKAHKILDSIFKVPGIISKYPIWKTITIGNIESRENLIEAVKKKGYRISNGAAKIISNLDINKSIEEIDLVRIPFKEIDLLTPNSVGLYAGDIIDFLVQEYLRFPTDEIGLQICLQCEQKDIGNGLLIGNPGGHHVHQMDILQINKGLIEVNSLYPFYPCSSEDWIAVRPRSITIDL